jgi:hypothetical protein
MPPLVRSTVTLALVFVWQAAGERPEPMAEPTQMRHEPVPLANARTTSLVNLGLWAPTDQHVGEAVAGAEALVAKDLMIISAASAAVAVARVGMVCTMPDGRAGQWQADMVPDFLFARTGPPPSDALRSCPPQSS